jgi:hypothetical protein
VGATDNYVMDSNNKCGSESLTRCQIVAMRAADWEAIGDDAKHIEEGRYYVLDRSAQGARVVEVEFTDRKPRRMRARNRSGQSGRS